MSISLKTWGKALWTSPLSQFLSLIHINLIFSDTALTLFIYLICIGTYTVILYNVVSSADKLDNFCIRVMEWVIVIKYKINNFFTHNQTFDEMIILSTLY
jgi:hypothetical protein